jgi:hypothetical protein
MRVNSHEEAVRRLNEAAQIMNAAISEAVNAGVSVQLVRTCRHHDGHGHWGDQVAPSIM